MSSFLKSFNEVAIVYPSHNKRSKDFSKALSIILDADIYKISIYNPIHSKNKIRSIIHNHLIRKTRSFRKRIETITTCSVDIDRYRAIIIICSVEGNHLSTECLSFLNSFYLLFASSPAKLLVVGLGSYQKKYSKDISRLKSQFIEDDVYVDIPIFILNSSIPKYMKVIDSMYQYVQVPKPKQQIQSFNCHQNSVFTERSTSTYYHSHSPSEFMRKSEEHNIISD
ncbi:hypothetical protein EDI_251630 [Entamoeba dispar SAW760]|uniref:Uncharacterized protein n=1 Tax=Entamoeba dispar (strain ATCC PRA-260 / SAW760) TaxID=370354 RepID=B0E6Y5_ENTDS|nr:uncharacterized protein EDI_251630 [Entamoeba dispar SAW760]EDR29726.1 hypothetical protein EDI_251630 [Entamoeba dispar SAW760]|eukprot:EDR29726.1 hypothetical protein EDI_251630 [Entamoeba dispar SAW760]